jgi:hypothetical protein
MERNKMNIPRKTYFESWSGLSTRNTAAICLLLAASFSLIFGISYPYSLAQVTLFYQYITTHLSMLISG